MNSYTGRRAIPAVFESILVLLGAAGITFMSSGLYLTIRGVIPALDALRGEKREVARYTFPLEEVRQDPLPHEELLERVRALEIADLVFIDSGDDGDVLVVEGTHSGAEPPSAVFPVLEAAGYQSMRVTLHHIGPDWVGLLATEGTLQRALPGLLTLQSIVFIGVGLLFVKLRVPRDEPGKRTGVAGAILIGLGAAVTAFALSVVIGTLFEWAGMPVPEQGWIVDLAEDPYNLLRLVPWIVVLVPISEEVFFRGYMFRFLSGRAGPVVGYVVSSLLFGLVHLVDVVADYQRLFALPVYVAIALVLAFVYERSSNLIAPIVGHMCFNALVLITLVYGA